MLVLIRNPMVSVIAVHKHQGCVFHTDLLTAERRRIALSLLRCGLGWTLRLFSFLLPAVPALGSHSGGKVLPNTLCPSAGQT